MSVKVFIGIMGLAFILFMAACTDNAPVKKQINKASTIASSNFINDTTTALVSIPPCSELPDDGL